MSRRLAAILVVLAIVGLSLPSLRFYILRTAGRSLVAEDPVECADVIVVTVDAGDAGLLEAADLVRRGVAPGVALLPEPLTPAQREYARRGIPYEDVLAASERQLRLLGVTTIERIPAVVDGTETETRALRDWSARRRLASLLVVSSTDHSRRVRRELRRSMRGSSTRVLVRSARYSEFNPDSWWVTRGGVRTEIVEFEKLLLDIAGHPLS